ncbi:MULTISPECIES: ArnT family glycosyltransferase [Prochlorococcus]|uniref:ArnT family glycosyltransferase n=1 Tax=Prochlorococcus TaxID=1218 RepID=UPI0005338FF3|nr:MULTISPECIES: glycosyltransferase family 39 protein [Prochlorococcus]KGG12530.1 4-amino-4-deoxy-L-arabinose transferase and related glycosyltransferase of PMT family [Prochlorococcus sp. MIT 0601]
MERIISSSRNEQKSKVVFWGLIILIWLVSTFLDRNWWLNSNQIPSWDPADYLNSAMSNGRALTVLPGGEWEGFRGLINHSSKIPPLASFVNGTIIALAGDAPYKAAWSLSLWHALLIYSVAGIGIKLKGRYFALLSVLFVAIAPALASLRLNYVLEMPVCASSTLALWLLGNWADPIKGGNRNQAIIAGISCSIALLIKQSSLLVIVPPIMWLTFMVIKPSKIKLKDFFIFFVIIIGSVLPWLKHNWITVISGTNRAVIASAAIEGDPLISSIDNWLYYAKVIPQQIGLFFLLIGLTGLIYAYLQSMKKYGKSNLISIYIFKSDYFFWNWLILNSIACWLLTTLVPNKDPRYITPLLPYIIIFLSLGWFFILEFVLVKNNKYKFLANILLIPAIYLVTNPLFQAMRVSVTNSDREWQISNIIKEVSLLISSTEKETLVVVPSFAELNQHNLSYYGRRNGGNILARQLGRHITDIEPCLNRCNLVLLAEGDLGDDNSVRESAYKLDKAIRDSKIFYKAKEFERVRGGTYSLWMRKSNYKNKSNFANEFATLAKGMENGPAGVKNVFDVIAVEHMIDGHRKYQKVAKLEALKNLKENPKTINSRWTLGLIAILENKPKEADIHFAALEQELINNPWPSAYRTIVNIAGWNPLKASYIANKASLKHNNYVLIGLKDASEILSGKVWSIKSAYISIPKAIEYINKISKESN